MERQCIYTHGYTALQLAMFYCGELAGCVNIDIDYITGVMVMFIKCHYQSEKTKSLVPCKSILHIYLDMTSNIG